MPFTAAHPLLVLPLRRTALPMSALVAGSTVPDVPVFLRTMELYPLTHGVLGILVVDPLLAVLALVLWFGWLRDAVVDLAPDVVRTRLAAHATINRARWYLVVPAAMLGALTHLLWDEVTHDGRWGTRHVPALAEHYGPWSGALWFSYVAGSVGSAVVAVVAIVWLVRRPRSRSPRSRRLPRQAWLLWPTAGVVAAVATAGVQRTGGLHAMAFWSVVVGTLASVAAVAVTAACWHVVRRVRPGGE